MKLWSFVAACLSLAGCTVMDVSVGRDAEVRSDGLVEGFASAGWVDDPNILQVELFDGRGDGSLAMVDLWHLMRVEVGLVGASLGLGPFDVGVGTLFYEPRSPAKWGDECDRGACGHAGCAKLDPAWKCASEAAPPADAAK